MAALNTPCTVYAVAPMWRHKLDKTRVALASRLFAVSGLEPLLPDEVAARGRAMVEEDWPVEIHGPLADYEYCDCAWSASTLTQ